MLFITEGSADQHWLMRQNSRQQPWREVYTISFKIS